MCRPIWQCLRATLTAVALTGVPMALGAQGDAPGGSAYDIVIAGGRVLDPETGFDGTANVGIRGGRIAAVTGDALVGGRTIDAAGKVVAPGFIDILSYTDGFTPEGTRYKVTDGVTTALYMHGGPVHPAAWYDSLSVQGRRINFGTTVSHDSLRLVLGIDRYAAPTQEQLERMVAMARRAILEGAIGIGFGVQYTPGATEEELFALFELAAEMGVPCHLHIRYLGPRRPDNALKGIQEVIANAAATGASAQVVHINSVAGHSMDAALRMIAGARRNGVDVMADAYPWYAGMTRLESTIFDPGWRERLLIDYGEVELVSSGERLTPQTFERYRADPELTWVIAHFVSRSGTIRALRSPYVMVGSDGGIRDGRGHPRGAGTYARFLREYVRENAHLTLMEAVRKMTLMPAQRLVRAAPVMRRKGRLSAGADADIVVFDLGRVRERATYREPARHSEGIDWVLVNGAVVVEDGRIAEGVLPGRPVRGAPARSSRR